MNKFQLPEKRYVASVDIHAQNTFTPLCPKELPVPDALAIVDELNTQAQFASKRIGSKEAHNPQAVWIADAEHPPLSPVAGDNVDVCWPPHAITGSFGFQLIEGLPAITDYDYFVWEGIELDMHPYGVCYHDHAERLSTGLIEYLGDNAIQIVLVGGLATDYCVKTSVLQLLKAGFTVIVNLAACRGIDETTTTQALLDMQQAGAVIIDSTQQLQAAKG